MNIKYIVMHCGYAENSHTSALIYQCQFFGNAGFSSYKEAITKLALDLYNKFRDDYSSISEEEFDYEEFQEYVSGLHCTTADSYSEAEHANGNRLNWWPFWTADFIGASKEETIFIGENAEVILLQALLEAKPELLDEDQDEGYLTDWESFKNNNQSVYR